MASPFDLSGAFGGIFGPIPGIGNALSALGGAADQYQRTQLEMNQLQNVYGSMLQQQFGIQQSAHLQQQAHDLAWAAMNQARAMMAVPLKAGECEMCGYIEGHGPRHWAGCPTQGGAGIAVTEKELALVRFRMAKPRAVVESAKDRNARFLREALQELDLLAPEGTIEPPIPLSWKEWLLVWVVRTFRLWSFASV